MSAAPQQGTTDDGSPVGKTAPGALWGARFAAGPSPELAALSKSTYFDWRLWSYDLRGSHAHANALAKAGYLSAEQLAAMHAGLDEVARRIESGELGPRPEDEDVHGALETALRGLGFRQVRVRYHVIPASEGTVEGAIARIEVGEAELDKTMDPVVRDEIVRVGRVAGFTFVTVDLAGYRMGSHNVVLAGGARSLPVVR